jgi:hypothetical protein
VFVHSPVQGARHTEQRGLDMVWDAGAFMRIAIGIFFLAFGAGLGYALFRLAAVFRRMTSILTDANKEVGPILARLETTLDEVNAEIGKVDQITGSVATMVETVEHTTTAVYRGVTCPVNKAAGFAAGVSEAVSSFFSGEGSKEE